MKKQWLDTQAIKQWAESKDSGEVVGISHASATCPISHCLIEFGFSSVHSHGYRSYMAPGEAGIDCIYHTQQVQELIARIDEGDEPREIKVSELLAMIEEIDTRCEKCGTVKRSTSCPK